MEDHGALEEKEQLENQNDINETAQMTASLEISEKVWGNHIICDKITSYLRISDLKDLSCVNHYFLHKVRSINRFTSLAGQVVTGKLEIHVFKLSRAIVLVDQIDVKALQERASEIFQETEYMEIHCLAELSYADRNSRLIQIIANCPKIKSLTFGKLSFVLHKIEPFLKNSSVKLILSKLEELHLEFNANYYSDKDHEEWYSTSETEFLADPPQSFQLISDMEMSLEKFSYESTPLQNFVSCFFSPKLVLSSSQNTLVELNLHVHFGATLGLENMKFPKLRKFSLMLNTAMNITILDGFNQQAFDMNLVIFLKNHLSSLTHLELDCPEYDTSFTAVCEILKLSKKIRVLLLGRDDWRSRLNRTTILIEEEWDNLAKVSNFCGLDLWTGRYQKDFVVNSQDNLTQFKRYGEILSPNANSFKFYCQGWKDLNNLDYFTDTVKSTFIKFQNLVELKMFAFLNDEILQFVCKHLTKLLVFEGDFSEVSDYGISGIREHDNYNSGISIANIKGLRRLCLYPRLGMPFKITWHGLLQSIHFLELVDFRVMGQLETNNPIMNEDVGQDNQRNYLRLICKSRNPSLENVFLTFYEPDECDHENIRRVNPKTRFYRRYEN